MSSDLQQRQQQLMDFLLGRDEAIASHVVDQGGIGSDIRLAIYRNAYRIRLRETIDVDHPVIGSYLGDDLFDQMVDGYIDNHPSSFSSLRQFADALPAFLAEHPPFAEHPQIAELARFERMLLSAFDAADADRLPADHLTTIPAEQWPELHIRFHPSVQLFNTEWNVVEIWQQLKAEQTPPAPEQETAFWLLWRNDERLTEFRSLSPQELVLLQGCLNGHNFAQLCEDLLEHVAEDEVANMLVGTISKWLQQGLISRIGE